jgi:AcrR family transcriptional regulator
LTKGLGTIEAAAQSGRMSGDERRSQILLVAIRLFSQHGFSGTTTKEIARQAGVSEAMVFRHFATKSDLYDAILDYKACQGGMNPLPWEENSPIKCIAEHGDDYAFFYNLALNALNKQQNDPDFMRLLFHSALEEHELAERFFEEFISRIYDFVGSYIARRQTEGAMRRVEPRIIVRAFLGMIIHHSLNNILWDKTRRLLDITNEEAAHAFAEILLRGVSEEKQR